MYFATLYSTYKDIIRPYIKVVNRVDTISATKKLTNILVINTINLLLGSSDLILTSLHTRKYINNVIKPIYLNNSEKSRTIFIN